MGKAVESQKRNRVLDPENPNGEAMNAGTSARLKRGRDEAEAALADRNERRCRWGLGIMVIGFMLQLASNYPDFWNPVFEFL